MKNNLSKLKNFLAVLYCVIIILIIFSCLMLIDTFNFERIKTQGYLNSYALEYLDLKNGAANEYYRAFLIFVPIVSIINIISNLVSYILYVSSCFENKNIPFQKTYIIVMSILSIISIFVSVVFLIFLQAESITYIPEYASKIVLKDAVFSTASAIFMTIATLILFSNRCLLKNKQTKYKQEMSSVSNEFPNISYIFGILSLFIVGVFLGPIAIVVGCVHYSKKEKQKINIRKSKAGIIFGITGVIISASTLLLFVFS